MRTSILTASLFIAIAAFGAGTRADRAPATPVAAYQKQVRETIQDMWSRYALQNVSVLGDGTVRMNFRVLANGRVTGLKIVSNSGDDKFAEICRRAVLDSSLPPVPDAVRDQLGRDFVEFREITFTLSPEAGGASGRTDVKVPR